jgi:hypothetical protein
MNEHREDLNNFTNTNFAQEQKIKGTRTREEVEKHSARGLAAEIALIDIGFVSNSPIVKDVTTIDFANRMIDLCAEGFNIAVKSKKSIYDKFYINQKQHKSISDSKKFNDLNSKCDTDDGNGETICEDFYIDYNFFCSKFHSMVENNIKNYLVDELKIKNYDEIIQYKNDVYLNIIKENKSKIYLVDGLEVFLNKILENDKKFIIVSNSPKAHLDLFFDFFQILHK